MSRKNFQQRIGLLQRLFSLFSPGDVSAQRLELDDSVLPSQRAFLKLPESL
jgi:hypothetical protein